MLSIMNLRLWIFFLKLTKNTRKYDAIYLLNCYQKFARSFEILDYSKNADFFTKEKQLKNNFDLLFTATIWIE